MRQPVLEDRIAAFEADLAGAEFRAGAVSEAVLNRPTPEPGDTSEAELNEYDGVVAKRDEAMRRVDTLREKLSELRNELGQPGTTE